MSQNIQAIKAEKLKRSDERDKEAFQSIHGIRLVVGYHFGFKKRRSTSERRHHKVLYVPYICTKPYTFRITSRTHHLVSCRKGNVATVITAYGKKNLVVDSYRDVPDDDKASQYKPVINFQDRSLSNYDSEFNWLYRHCILEKADKKH